MSIQAHVAYCNHEFTARLPNGKTIKAADFRNMAQQLFLAGVDSTQVQFEWRPGQRMITAGQQVALRAEINRLQRRDGAPARFAEAAAA